MPLTPKSIKAEVLRQLPYGRFVRFEKTRDMNDNEVEAIVWGFIDEKTKSFRTAFFAVESGVYIGDDI